MPARSGTAGRAGPAARPSRGADGGAPRRSSGRAPGSGRAFGGRQAAALQGDRRSFFAPTRRGVASPARRSSPLARRDAARGRATEGVERRAHPRRPDEDEWLDAGGRGRSGQRLGGHGAFAPRHPVDRVGTEHGRVDAAADPGGQRGGHPQRVDRRHRRRRGPRQRGGDRRAVGAGQRHLQPARVGDPRDQTRRRRPSRGGSPRRRAAARRRAPPVRASAPAAGGSRRSSSSPPARS